jgi:hypothetical protein
MTDLTIDRAAHLDEPVRDALPSAGAEQGEPAPVREARTGEVRLTRLVALAALSPAQAVEVGAGLLAVVELDQAREHGDPDDGGPAIDRITVDVGGRVIVGPGPRAGGLPAVGVGAGAPARGDAALLGELAGAVRAQVGPGNPVNARLVDELDRAVAELPVAGVAAVRQRLEEACAALDRRAVRAELGALVRALTASTGTAGPGDAARPERMAEAPSGAPPPAGPRRAVRTRFWAWLLSVAVLVAVVALEVVLLRDNIAADVHLLLEAGRSGSTASAATQPDGLPVIPPAPPAAGAVAGIDVRPLTTCMPATPCTVRVLLRLVPAADPRTASWRFELTDRCTGATDSASGGSVTVPAGSQNVAVVDTVPLPPYSAVAVSAVTEQPAVAAAPPVLLGSCTSG